MADLSAEQIERCRAGDVAVLGEIYDVLGVRVYRLCRSLLGHDADAEDATQEVFLRLLAKASSFRGESRFSTWVYRLTVNLCHNRRRARRAHDSLESLDDSRVVDGSGDAAAAVAEQREARELVDRLLARLPAADRAILALREIEELSYREISTVLDVPEGTVMSRLSRARERLRGLVEQSAADGGMRGPVTSGVAR